MTPTEISYLKRLLGVYACEFKNADLENLYNDAVTGGATNLIAGAAALGFYNLMTGAVEMTNFRQGETQENEAVIYDRLASLYNLWSNKAGFPAPLPTFDINVIRLHYVDFPEETE